MVSSILPKNQRNSLSWEEKQRAKKRKKIMHYMQSTKERREHFSLPLGFGRAESPKRLAI
jgi:hypothetical protein